MTEIGIIDYGCGNIFSLQRAFAHLGHKVQLVKSQEQIESSDKLILPGVGAFASVVQKINDSGLKTAIVAAVKKRKPLLGICVGMQVLFESSTEFGKANGLCLLNGKVERLPGISTQGSQNRIPHIGWAELDAFLQQEGKNNLETLIAPISDYQSYYFVHSFCAVPQDPKVSVATIEFGGHRIVAAVAKDMLFGTQFHPEKSGQAGLTVLDKFARL